MAIDLGHDYGEGCLSARDSNDRPSLNFPAGLPSKVRRARESVEIIRIGRTAFSMHNNRGLGLGRCANLQVCFKILTIRSVDSSTSPHCVILVVLPDSPEQRLR